MAFSKEKTFERTMTSTNDGTRIYYKLTCELSPIIITNTLIKTSFASVINICVFRYWWKEIESIIHLEQAFHSLTKTWKYGGSVFGTEVAGGAQIELIMCLFLRPTNC